VNKQEVSVGCLRLKLTFCIDTTARKLPSCQSCQVAVNLYSCDRCLSSLPRRGGGVLIHVLSRMPNYLCNDAAAHKLLSICFLATGVPSIPRRGGGVLIHVLSCMPNYLCNDAAAHKLLLIFECVRQVSLVATTTWWRRVDTCAKLYAKLLMQ